MDWLKELLKKLGVADAEVDKIDGEVAKELPKHFVPKTQYNEAVEARKKAEKDVADRDTQLEGLKKSAGDNEELKKQIETLQGENKTAKEKYEAEVKDLRLSTALKLALASDAHDPDLVVGLLDKAKIELDDAGNVKAGLDDQLKGLRTGKPFLFKEQQKPRFRGANPQSGSDPDFNTSPELAQLREDYKKAVESKNMPLQISLKNQIFEMEKKGTGEQ